MKSLLFDFGGTLDADGTTWPDRFYPLYKEAGIDAGKERFAQAFYLSDDTLPRRFMLKGISFEETLCLQVSQVLADLAPEKRGQGQVIARRFLDNCRAHFRRNRPVLERLGRHYQLGIVSNFYGNIDSVLKSEGLRGLFASVADSGALGMTKPQPEIFLHALKELGSTPAESVIVGDSIPRDMRGAEALGMAHAKVGPTLEQSCCPQAWNIKTLPELEVLLSSEAALR